MMSARAHDLLVFSCVGGSTMVAQESPIFWFHIANIDVIADISMMLEIIKAPTVHDARRPVQKSHP